VKRHEFLEVLGNYLHDLPSAEANDAKRYYDELIMDAVENGNDEEEFIASLGDMGDIAGRIRSEADINRAVSKPGMSNWAKAMIAVLGILATPIALPLAAAVLLVFLALIVTAVAVVIAIFAALVAGLAYAGWALVRLPFSFGSVGIIFTAIGLAVLGGMGAYYLLRVTFKGTGILFRKIYVFANEKRAEREQRAQKEESR
jgi:uncharacterized membrane protein